MERFLPFKQFQGIRECVVLLLHDDREPASNCLP